MNMNLTEARRRAAVHGMAIAYYESEFRVYFPEYKRDQQEATAYYTDCAEDAAITAGKMRRTAQGNNAR